MRMEVEDITLAERIMCRGLAAWQLLESPEEPVIGVLQEAAACHPIPRVLSTAWDHRDHLLSLAAYVL